MGILVYVYAYSMVRVSALQRHIYPLPLCPQVCANIIIFVATNLVGVFYNYISDTARRKSFSETRRFIRSLIAIGLENRKVVSGGDVKLEEEGRGRGGGKGSRRGGEGEGREEVNYVWLWNVHF